MVDSLVVLVTILDLIFVVNTDHMVVNAHANVGSI